MKILDAAQIRRAEELTEEKQGLEKFELMERASLGVFHYIDQRLQGQPIPIYVFCGVGNNGADGLALAQHLFDHGYHMQAFLVNYGDRRSEGFIEQLEKLKTRKIYPQYVNDPSEMPLFEQNGLIVDALFGIGLNRDPNELIQSVIQGINQARCFVLAMDMPSGMFLDRVPAQPDWVIKADMVLTFQTPKLVFFLPDTYDFIGNWRVIDIGLDEDVLKQLTSEYELVEPQELLPWYRQRKTFAHKGNFGHVLLAGGSRGMMGSMVLAARACMKIGAGKATAWVPDCGLLPLQLALPEAMVRTDPGENYLISAELPIKPGAFDILVMGMGMGTRDESLEALKGVLKLVKGPLVLDADALNLLGKNPRLIKSLPSNSVLLPHPKELKGLIGDWKDDFHKLEKARAFVRKYHCILVIKGAHTLILHEGGTLINNTGNPGMATAGSGDVLAGVVAGLVAQSYSPLQAAVLGVMLHGLAGDIAATQMGYEALNATDLIDHLGKAFMHYIHPPRTRQAPEVDQGDEP